MSAKKEKGKMSLILLVGLVSMSEPLIMMALFPSVSYLAALLLSICLSTLMVIGVSELLHRKEDRFSISGV